MGDLLEHELSEMDEDCQGDCPCEMHRMVTEVRRHRATMLRLEAWAVDLEAKRDQPGDVGHFIAAELRNRIKGDSK